VTAESTNVQDRIGTLVNSNDIVLFMKGTPMFPQCGFSSTAVAILERLGVAFEGVDVLADPEIRQGVKVFSDWPTVPQLYVKGEFVGGSDIMMEMYQAGELTALIEQAGIARASA
jgi:monothiol glutaredoxin